MKQRTTFFLKLAVIVISITVLTLCVFGIYFLANNPVNPDYRYILYPISIGIYVSVIPFYITLYKFFILLSYIDKKRAYSQISVKALKDIKYCAMAISTLYVVIMPFIILLADKDDAPGAIIIGMLPIFTSIVIAALANVLKQKLQRKIE
ncbi:DUF2975 domain-containing protein [Clostridium hydrogeniformans]|uniref:DUF2975 domain-containing protein n=1 Tax=Clostridium hydrogeniformans TaxID=349933 RepID=UPI00048654B4|nr:DUF2975 domain-containing protein [Clostridium hydrogeniformans]